MNADDRLRQAFEDLEHRTGSVDPRYSLQRLARTTERRGWIPALAGAAVVLTVIGVVAVSGILSGEEQEVVTDTTGTTAVTDISVPPETDTPVPAPSTTITPELSDDVRLPTHRVTGVAQDDVLNVRREPGAGGDLYAELPPDYTGIRLVDNVAIVQDGGEWWQVELLDPIRLIGLEEPLHGAPITGWVNSAFLAEYEPSLPSLAPCEGEVGVPSIEGSGPDTDHVYAIRQFGLGGCIRTVVTFGRDFDETRPLYDRITTDMRPAGTPPIRVEQVNGTSVFVLEGVPYAWATQSGTFESSVALVGRWTDGSLAIYVTVPGFTSARIAGETGQLVIDVTPSGAASPSGSRFHLLGEPVIGAGGTVEVWGVARPFEANIGTVILGSDGSPVEGVGPPFVMTNDWTEAWGLFQYRARGVEPGEYLLTLVQEGGDQAIELDVPFTVPDREPESTVTEADLATADELRALARGEDSGGELTFTTRVGAWLGVDHTTTDGWTLDVEEWNGYAGPFDVLAPLRDATGPVVVTVGEQPHCAGPPLDLPAELRIHRRLAIRPAGITSCLEWWSVEAFVDDQGRIAHVMLDLWEP